MARRQLVGPREHDLMMTKQLICTAILAAAAVTMAGTAAADPTPAPSNLH